MSEEALRGGHYPHQVGIEAYGAGGFRFAGMSHRGSLLCLPSGMHAWAARVSADIDADRLAPVLEAPIEVLFVGTGPELIPFAPALRDMFREKGITVEAIATGSAVRTYNVLLGEGRPVGAALLAVERAR